MRLLTAPPPYERRTPDQLHTHYQVEKELAQRLKDSRKEERSGLYSLVYNELFKRVPLHPQLTRVQTPAITTQLSAEKLQLLRSFLTPQTVFLELGAGDCRLSLEVARHTQRAYALDVSREVSKGIQPPDNFTFVLSDGCNVPLPDNSVHVAYSYQLMEHIHPDDALEQLRNLYAALAPGGVYVCITPNRLTGPHDISRYFDHTASGLHLKEYTITEVSQIFRSVGFESVTAFAGLRGKFTNLPMSVITPLERSIDAMPPSLRRVITSAPLIRNVLLAAIVGRKPR